MKASNKRIYSPTLQSDNTNNKKNRTSCSNHIAISTHYVSAKLTTVGQDFDTDMTQREDSLYDISRELANPIEKTLQSKSSSLISQQKIDHSIRRSTESSLSTSPTSTSDRSSGNIVIDTISNNNNNICQDQDHQQSKQKCNDSDEQIELRFLISRRDAGALIGKRGAVIRDLRETFNSSFAIPDCGNAPERVLTITTHPRSMDEIMHKIISIIVERNSNAVNQYQQERVEMRMLIHSSHAGSIIGRKGVTIQHLRDTSRAAIKIFSLCCPMSNERVCAIKATPSTVVDTINLILNTIKGSAIKGTVKPYDAINHIMTKAEQYGGFTDQDELNDVHGAGLRNQWKSTFGICSGPKDVINPVTSSRSFCPGPQQYLPHLTNYSTVNHHVPQPVGPCQCSANNHHAASCSMLPLIFSLPCYQQHCDGNHCMRSLRRGSGNIGHVNNGHPHMSAINNHSVRGHYQ